MDRLGDLICTLPVDQNLSVCSKENEKELQFHWLITKGLEPILEMAQPKRNFFSFSPVFKWKSFFQLISLLRNESFEQSITFFSPWWISLALLLARIPKRSSPKSRWHQFLFSNHTLKQSRSFSSRHEADYNSELFCWSLGLPYLQKPLPYLNLKTRIPCQIDLPENFIVVHPGMGGSALNWPSTKYIQLIRELTALNKSVVITGTNTDQEWLNPIFEAFGQNSNVHWLVNKLNLFDLVSVLQRSDAVIAPSTGVLHLAASTGVKTIGIYSPIRVQTPLRWGPRGEKTSTLMPQFHCPAKTKCLLEACPHHPCLNSISTQQVSNAMFEI